MLLLVVGAKGGLGATTLVRLLCRQAEAVPLDAADGRLAVDLSTPGASVLDLADTPQWTVARHSQMADQVVRTRQPLLWSRACGVWPDQVATFVADVAALTVVVADGGIAPPPDLVKLASLVLIVSADDPVARWHEQRLKAQWPASLAVVGDLKAAAQAIAAQTLGVPMRKGLLERAHSTLRRTGVRSEQ
jgi:hypothetical protein